MTISNFKKFFDGFENLVHGNRLKKIEYKDWKKINNFLKNANNDSRVYFCRLGEAFTMTLFEGDTGDTVHKFIFHIDDESFGEYLDKNYLRFIKENGEKNDLLTWDSFKSKLSDSYNYITIDTIPDVEYIPHICDIKTASEVNFAATSTIDAAKTYLNDYSTSSSTADAAKIGNLNFTPSISTADVATINYLDNSAKSYLDTSCSTSSDYYTTTGTYTTISPNSIVGTISLDDCLSTKADKYEIDTIKSEIEAIKEKMKNENEKENNKMTGFNFDFGPCSGDNIRMSMYGLAIRNSAGTWVAYDAKNRKVMDVEILNFTGFSKYLYRMPMAISAIAVGDTIIHNRKPVFVTEITDQKKIVVVDIFDGEEKIIMPAMSPFGFNFVTKVVSLFEMMGGGASNQTASAENPFGNMLPLMMMGEGENIKDMLPLMFMMGGANGEIPVAGNQNMMMGMMAAVLMSKDAKAEDILPLMFVMGGMSK